MRTPHLPPEISEGAEKFDRVFSRRDQPCTLSYYRNLRSYFQAVNFFFFVTRITARLDEVRVRAAEALIPGAPPGEVDDLTRSANDPNVTQRELQKFSSTLSMTLVNAAVSAMQLYYSELLRDIIVKRPEILRSSQTVRVEEVLHFKRHSDLIGYLVGKKLNEISYGGLKEKERYLREQTGLEMFQTEEQRLLLSFFVEIRNINVHNGGIVNELFLARVGTVPGFSPTLGERLHVDLDHFALLVGNARDVNEALDQSASDKFRLMRKKYHLWKK